ncbi:MAG: ABC transporter ATP-binding protein [Lachnospiraceae bacterium]|nr:ABC transporter ATP-binding protein [Lachnospiraceae bacterium]
MIKFSNVSFKYVGNKTEKGNLDDIDLTIADGEFIVLTGESGCGKTTFTRLINGLVPGYYHGEVTGNIEVNGENTQGKSIAELGRNIGSVFQNPRSQFFNVDTDSELAFAAENIGVDPAQILRSMDEVTRDLDLEKLRKRSIFELSGGEKQRIACGSVAVMHPKTVILDEPSSNLDRESIEQLRTILGIWKKEGKTVIIAEHRLYYLRDLVDRLLIMKNGKIERIIDSDEIKRMSADDNKKLGIRPFDEQEYIEKAKRKTERKTAGNSGDENGKLAAEQSGDETGKSVAEQSGDEIFVSQMDYSYNKKEQTLAVRNLHLPLNRVVAIVGKNGVGKSTLIKALCGILKARGEKVYLKGEEWKSKKRIKNCYMVFQDVNHQLFTDSVLSELTIGMDDKLSDEKKKEEAEKILKRLGLEEFGESHPMALSGGQKQRAAIAACVASGRDILFLDEPTSGMDEMNMLRLADEMKHLKELGKSVFVVTHDYEFIDECCDAVVELK